MSILVAITKARDIAEFDNAVADVLSGFDKLWCCYYPSNVARQKIKKFFLENEEYGRLAICPDDMLVNRDGINHLLNDLETDYEIICGCANVDTLQYRNTLSISVSKVLNPSVSFGIDSYEFLVEGSALHKSLLIGRQPIIVKHMGDPFPIIRRDTVEKLSFYNTSGTPTGMGCCEDVVMSHELHRLGVPIYCDLRARFDHLKISDAESASKLQIGKKEPYMKLERRS